MQSRFLFITLSFLVMFFTTTTVNAQLNDNSLEDLFSDEPSFLPVEEAFVFDFSQNGDTLVVRFEIADGYYLYKKQFKASTKNATLGEPAFPPAEQIEDEFFGISDVFYNTVSFSYPIIETVQDGVVKLRYQGCATAGLCYPPTTKVIYLNTTGPKTVSVPLTGGDVAPADSPATEVVSEQYELASLLQSDQNLPVTLLLFLALGIGLAFTPCVFPMYPIVSGIVIGQGKDIKLSRAFTLAFVYVQGMAIMYSLLGLVVASAGVQFQASLQSPYILGTFIVVFIALAIAMFGAYEIQLPSSWQEKVSGMSNAQRRGSLAGVFVMGILSGLIASPCTTAPLTGVLIFIAQSGDMTLGFLALYALSLGMGIPLIIFAMTGGKLLPKAGNWMNVIKTTFGFMLLAVAIIFIERLWNSDYSLLLWSLLGLGAFSYYQVVNQPTPATFAKGVRSLLIFIGLFASAMLAYNTLLSDSLFLSNSMPPADNRPLSNNAPSADNTRLSDSAPSGESTVVKAAEKPSPTHPEFVVVKDLADFEQKLAAANAQGKSVMVDLYADWCVACKEFEKYTFVDADVINALSDTVWMQIDLTDNTPTNLAFQKTFNVFGLPTIMLFDKQGNELSKARITGFMRAGPFAQHVRKALGNDQ